MMKSKNTASAKSKRFITNTIVHVILAVFGSYLGHSDCVDYYDQL